MIVYHINKHQESLKNKSFGLKIQKYKDFQLSHKNNEEQKSPQSFDKIKISINSARNKINDQTLYKKKRIQIQNLSQPQLSIEKESRTLNS